MFKNFHWGHGITIFYIIFVIAIVTVLFASFGVDRTLVVEDYYAKDLAYQEQYDKMQNAIQANESKLVVNILGEQELVELIVETDAPIQGKVAFYRPSDKTQDFSVDFISAKSTYSTASLLKGKWILKVEWNEGSKSYYQERQIYIS